MNTLLRSIALQGMALLMAAPHPARGAEVRAILDRGTGTTLQVTAEPWVLAQEHPHLAVHARDYIALHAVETNNAGSRHHYLAAFYWSTVPGRNRHAGLSPSLRLRLDDRDISLVPAASLQDAGISHWPLRRPGRDALLVLYPVDPLLLRQVAYAGRLQARPDRRDSEEPPEAWFDSWRDARSAFREFSREILAQP